MVLTETTKNSDGFCLSDFKMSIASTLRGANLNIYIYIIYQ